MTGEQGTDGFLEEIIDRCVQRIANGEQFDAVLASYPAHAAELRALLAPAHTLMSAAVPPVGRAAESMALGRMLAEVRSAHAQPHARNFLLVWLGSLKARPLAYQALAITGAAIVFGGVSLGAAAATGSTPAPVRRILRISADSQHKLTLKGTIASLSADTLTLRTDGSNALDVRTVALTALTTFSRGEQRIARADLRVGDAVEIDAMQNGSDNIEATSVRAHDAAAPAAGAPTAAASSGTHVTRSPEATTPGAPAGSTKNGATPPSDGSHATGAGDERTPEQNATPKPGDTPHPGDDHGDATPHDGATPVASSTMTPGSGEHDGTPESTHAPEPTEKPESTHAAEPTGTPEPTQAPEPTAQPEPTESHDSSHDEGALATNTPAP